MLTDLTSAILGEYIWHGSVRFYFYNKVKWAEIWGSTSFIKMVRDGKELSTDLKETIMGLDQEGYSACKIAEFLSFNRRTVSYIIIIQENVCTITDTITRSIMNNYDVIVC
jgi:hypothetical protein